MAPLAADNGGRHRRQPCNNALCERLCPLCRSTTRPADTAPHRPRVPNYRRLVSLFPQRATQTVAGVRGRAAVLGCGSLAWAVGSGECRRRFLLALVNRKMPTIRDLLILEVQSHVFDKILILNFVNRTYKCIFVHVIVVFAMDRSVCAEASEARGATGPPDSGLQQALWAVCRASCCRLLPSDVRRRLALSHPRSTQWTMI